jgi:hypothetical protein
LFFLCLLPPLTVMSDAMDRTTASRAALAASYLVKAQLGSGFFRYEHDFLSGRASKKNNIVRQAGTTYALAEYLAQFPGAQVEAALQRAWQALATASISWGDGSLVTVDGNPDKAKAGATALALLSLLMDAKSPAAVERVLAAGWLKGLLALQMPNGGFAARPDSTKQSAYSNGEIWLALARYAALYPEHAAAAAALQRADDFMIRNYGVSPEIGFFHWGVMAAAARYAHTGKQRFVDFIVQQTGIFLEQLRPRVKPDSNSCYSVEGLIEAAAAINAHGGYPVLHRRIMERVEREMEKNHRLQILPGQQRLTFGDQRFLVAPELADYAGAFLNGRYRPQVRVDATQHCLSAMVKVFRIQG